MHHNSRPVIADAERLRALSSAVGRLRALNNPGGKRKFAGIATTTSVDHYAEIVEPGGMEVVLPVPLLWEHNSSLLIGWVTSAKVTAKGVEIEGEIADLQDPGPLKDRLDTAWAYVETKYVRGLSIGFLPLEYAPIENSSGGRRHMKWELLELSICGVPANADCSITSIKSHGQPQPVVRLNTADIASKSNQARRPGAVYIN